jgi:hypothetical protein
MHHLAAATVHLAAVTVPPASATGPLRLYPIDMHPAYWVFMEWRRLELRKEFDEKEKERHEEDKQEIRRLALEWGISEAAAAVRRDGQLVILI